MIDDAFIAAVLADPRSDDTRLVYADWLEERGDPRAELLRVECQLLKLSPSDKLAVTLRSRLEVLHQNLDADWVALLRRVPLKDSIEAALSTLESLMPGLNYMVGLEIQRVPLMLSASPEL